MNPSLLPARAGRARARLLASFAVLAILFSGCTSAGLTPTAANAAAPGAQTLRPGDLLKITFPRASALDTTQQIRRDGMINLPLVGEIAAADLTPATLESQLLDRYASQLVSREVRVTVVSSSFAIFVTGAVIHPGKLTPDRTLTAFDAIVEAGGFDLAKADTKAVIVIRREGGTTRNFTLNLKAILEGRATEPFYLQANDVVHVKEKFSWF